MSISSEIFVFDHVNGAELFLVVGHCVWILVWRGPGKTAHARVGGSRVERQRRGRRGRQERDERDYKGEKRDGEERVEGRQGRAERGREGREI